MAEDDVPRPNVSGISPKEGTPRTKITIRGENLGQSAEDLLEVNICGQDCTRWAQWSSTTRVVCQSGDYVGWGEVVITTSSGGKGSCTIRFKGLPPVLDSTATMDPFLEMDRWVDEPDNVIDHARLASPLPTIGRTLANPLGLSVDEARSGRVKQLDLFALFPGGTGSLLSENFNANWFLLDKYMGVGFEDLKSGMAHLDHELEKRSAGTTSFIKEHVGSFIQCYDTLTAVHEALIRNEKDQVGGLLTDKAEDTISNAYALAESTYASTLHYRKKADSIRNALAVLQKYRFLFNLPRSIERSISNGDYDLVANEYERAQSLFTGTRVMVFQRVLEKVEQQIDECRVRLRRKLQELPAPIEEQKKLIKYLLELDCEGDPAWECITNMHKWMQRLLVSTMHSYLQQGSQPDSSKPSRILFVEEVTELVKENLPDLWKLGVIYLSKSLYAGIELSEEQVQVLKGVENHKEEFETMVNEMVEIYSDMVLLAFFPDHWSRIPEEQQELLQGWNGFPDAVETARPWLTTCVREIRSCLASFQQRQLRTSLLMVMQMLVGNVRQHCMEVLFAHATQEIESLHAREDWRVQAEEEGCITSLPLVIENITVEVLLTLKEVVVIQQPGDDSTTLLDDSEVLLKGMLEKIVECLQYLAFRQEQDLHEEALARMSAGVGGSADPLSSLGETADDNTPHSDQRLVIILSNCYYLRTQVVLRIFDCFRTHGYPHAKKTEDFIAEQLSELDVKVFKEYTERKRQPLLAILEGGMYSGSFDWEECPPMQGIRTYIRELLIAMLYTHNEVHAISSQLVHRVMSSLLTMVAHEMMRMLEEVGNFSEEGALHAYAEVITLKECLAAYSTPTAEKYFSDAINITGVLAVRDGEASAVKEIIEAFKQSNSLQLRCFTA